jgi:hypothetical protein
VSLDKKLIRSLSVLLTFLILGTSLQAAEGAQPTQVSSDGLNVKVFPIYAPDMTNERDCTEGSIGVSRIDGQAFSYNDAFDLRSTFPGRDGYPAYIFHTQFGKRADDGLNMTVMGKNIVTMTPYSKEPPKTVALTFTLCTFDFTSWKANQIPKVLNVEIEYFKNFSSSVAKIKIPVQILPRDSEAVLISDLRKECGQNHVAKKFTYNMTVQQTESPKKSGDLVGISGTLFRHGFPSPNDEISLFIESKKYADPRTLVAKTQTDGKGQFKFSFPIVRDKGANSSTYVIVAYNRAEPIGPISGPFDEMAYTVDFLWEPTARYFQGTNDWVPAHTVLCKEKIDAYNALVSSQQAKIFEDDRNRLLWFTAKSVYYGFKDKKTYTTYSKWDRATGGRCFVSGYTTSSGKRVSGYSRRCP